MQDMANILLGIIAEVDSYFTMSHMPRKILNAKNQTQDLPFSSNSLRNVINFLLSFNEDYHFISPLYSKFSQKFG